MRPQPTIKQQTDRHAFCNEIRRCDLFGRKTAETSLAIAGWRVPVFTNEFWTSRQRAAHSLHEISYRACFKPQLPRFFIERLTQTGDVVYDPFMGRGTTLLESALTGRIPVGNDINPLCAALIRPRLAPPTLEAIAARLREILFQTRTESPDDLLVFYHPETLREICALRRYLSVRRSDGDFDTVDDWIQMVAINRLTGHSPGFFSVYTLPPNQAVSVAAQEKINTRLKQKPPRRLVPELILNKSKKLLAEFSDADAWTLSLAKSQARFFTQDAVDISVLANESVALVVTSPPFLNVVDYAADNWLRLWFLGLDATPVQKIIHHRLSEWQTKMTAVFFDLSRVLRRSGFIAFEVGEVKNGKLNLEEAVLPCGLAAGLEPVAIIINDQKFTKTAHCWGVANNKKGTNTNRVLVFRKP